MMSTIGDQSLPVSAAVVTTADILVLYPWLLTASSDIV